MSDVGGTPDAYPVECRILALKDGAVLKLTDAFGKHAEIVLSADDIHLLAWGLLGALRHQSVSGPLGADDVITLARLHVDVARE